MVQPNINIIKKLGFSFFGWHTPIVKDSVCYSNISCFTCPKGHRVFLLVECTACYSKNIKETQTLAHPMNSTPGEASKDDCCTLEYNICVNYLPRTLRRLETRRIKVKTPAISSWVPLSEKTKSHYTRVSPDLTGLFLNHPNRNRWKYFFLRKQFVCKWPLIRAMFLCVKRSFCG